MKKRSILFDLDGVLVENCPFEERVTSTIISSIADNRGCSTSVAAAIWSADLWDTIGNSRWHDYAFHCDRLGLGDVWESAHLAAEALLSPVPFVVDVVKHVARQRTCWIVSDATDWVIRFKLNAIGIDPGYFEQVFSLDRCGSRKTQAKYWKCVAGVLASEVGAHTYVDNRIDLLLTAASVLPSIQLVWLQTPDHPDSLGFVRHLGEHELASKRIRAAVPETLASVLEAG